MPAAVKFLLNFNDSQFNVQVRARDYYSFFSTTMLAGGIVFQLPLAILAVTRLGIVRVEQLSSNRRYAYLVIAIVAAALPGVDPVSMLIEMVPLLVSVRVEYLARAGLRQAGGGGRHGGALNPGAVSELMAAERRAADGLRHPGTAQTRRPSRLRDPRPADGRQPLPRRRPGQHRRPLRQQQRHHQRRQACSKNRPNGSNGS